MRIIKLALTSVVVLFVVVWLFSLMIPSTIRVSRAVDLSASKDSLLAAVTDLRQWPKWNEMANEQFAHVQTTNTSFSSDQVTIKAGPLTGDSLITNWKLANGRSLIGGFTWNGSDGKLVLQWYFDIHLRWYPWEKFSGIIFDKQLGPSMEKSLGTLKKLLENKP